MSNFELEVRDDVVFLERQQQSKAVRIPINCLPLFLGDEVYDESNRDGKCWSCDKSDPNELFAFTPDASKVWPMCGSCKESLQEDLREIVEEHSDSIVAENL